MRTTATIVTLGLFLALSATTFGGDAKKEKAKFEGTWTFTKMLDEKGADVSFRIGDGGTTTFTFAGDKVTIKSGKDVDEGTFKIVDATKKPFQVDLNSKKKGTAKMIYEFDGDNLKLAMTPQGDQRPTGFNAKDKAMGIMFFKKSSK